MHSAAIPSTSTAASTSSLASTITTTTTNSARHSNNHYNHLHDELDPRSSVLRQYSDEEKLLKVGKSGHQVGSSSGNSSTSRPASKARRTSSGGSRIPSEDVDQNRGSQAGSSASDSGGSDWRHGPKSYGTTAASSIPIHPSASTAASTASETASAADATVSDGSISRMMEKMPERASTSSSYFNKAALAAAAAATSSLPDGNHGRQPESSSPLQTHLDLAKYPAQDLLRLLAALLAQIATANDQLRPKGISTPPTTSSNDSRQKSKDQSNIILASNNSVTASSSNSSIASSQDGRGNSKKVNGNDVNSSPGLSQRPTTAALSALQAPSSTLCFHARNIPSISIESYLLRILKYCPATNEVFLSLLIYFDRMSKMGAPTLTNSARSESLDKSSSSRADQNQQSENGYGNEEVMHAGMKGFAIDSYNVHRLVIAGVTVASKFFSDVFYTNSRYAKVGGLPVHELNQLELQFLLLNDFKLVIPLEEMQRYADQLLVYGGAPQSTWSDTPQSADNHHHQNHHHHSRSGLASPRPQSHPDVSMRDG